MVGKNPVLRFKFVGFFVLQTSSLKFTFFKMVTFRVLQFLLFLISGLFSLADSQGRINN
jgi:hypothetical protein